MILDELKLILEGCGYATEFAYYSDLSGDKRAVLTPMGDELTHYGDNVPLMEISSVRVSIFTKGDYYGDVKAIKKALINNDFCITDSKFIEHEKDTKYNHYIIDVEKDYDF
ncbi:hypothetical protein FACS1894132_09700 [Clostridia bacterium]|nr:hypothetical protein FACS1894132_09700 [Clostridia bacterium]